MASGAAVRLGLFMWGVALQVLVKKGPLGIHLVDPHPVIVAIRDNNNKDYIRVLLYSFYTTITLWGVLLRNALSLTRVLTKQGTWNLHYGHFGGRYFEQLPCLRPILREERKHEVAQLLRVYAKRALVMKKSGCGTSLKPKPSQRVHVGK